MTLASDHRAPTQQNLSTLNPRGDKRSLKRERTELVA